MHGRNDWLCRCCKLCIWPSLAGMARNHSAEVPCSWSPGGNSVQRGAAWLVAAWQIHMHLTGWGIFLVHLEAKLYDLHVGHTTQIESCTAGRD